MIGKCCDNMEFKINTMQQLVEIPEVEYGCYFQQWESHWNKCVQAAGLCFEGD
jgi:hypothetical protein